MSPNKRQDKSLINLDEFNIDEDTLLISSSQRCMSNENEFNNTKNTQNIPNFDCFVKTSRSKKIIINLANCSDRFGMSK